MGDLRKGTRPAMAGRHPKRGLGGRSSRPSQRCRHPDREGDVAVIGETNLVIGASAAEHALTNLGGARLDSAGVAS
jgi:hypothetical protein